MKLTIELIPQGTWTINVRSAVTKKMWKAIREKCISQAENKCEYCGSEESPFHVHEVFDYSKPGIQRLTSLTCICSTCHWVKHIGLASVMKKFDVAISQLRIVNGMTDGEARNYVVHCFDLWRKRNKIGWKVDLSYLNLYTEDIGTVAKR